MREKGTFARVCGTKAKTEKVRYVLHCEPLDNANELFVGLVNNGDNEGKRKWSQKLHVWNCWVSFKLETGTDVSIISERQYLTLRSMPNLEKTLLS